MVLIIRLMEKASNFAQSNVFPNFRGLNEENASISKIAQVLLTIYWWPLLNRRPCVSNFSTNSLILRHLHLFEGMIALHGVMILEGRGDLTSVNKHYSCQ